MAQSVVSVPPVQEVRVQFPVTLLFQLFSFHLIALSMPQNEELMKKGGKMSIPFTIGQKKDVLITICHLQK